LRIRRSQQPQEWIELSGNANGLSVRARSPSPTKKNLLLESIHDNSGGSAGDVGIQFRVGPYSNIITAMKITENGNVGIGTTSPGAKLEVAGQIKITGGSPGANKVLTSDANGLATWQSISAGDITSVAESGTTPLTFSNCDTGACLIGMDMDCGDAASACVGGHTHSHNHDGVYAGIGHNHDGSYAAIVHNHDAAYVNAGGDSMSGSLDVMGITLSDEGTYKRLQSWGGEPLAINPEGNNVGIRVVNPSIDLAIEDSDSGIQYISNRIEIMKDNVARIRVYGDSTGIYFYNNGGTQKLAIGEVGTRVSGNLIIDNNNYIQFPVRDTAPYACDPAYQGMAYFRTQSPEILCVCSGDGTSWKWFGTANGNEYVCAE
jgi:hypothetical protein